MSKKKFIIKTQNSWEFVTKEINKDLQKNNTLTERGIFLIDFESGIAWGYDADIYILDENSKIRRKKDLEKERSSNLLKNNEEIESKKNTI